MKCPFTFSNPASDADDECRGDCALRMGVKRGGEFIGSTCAIAAVASGERFGSTMVAVLVDVNHGADCFGGVFDER